jgi:hypothetical protein
MYEGKEIAQHHKTRDRGEKKDGVMAYCRHNRDGRMCTTTKLSLKQGPDI